MGGSTVLPHCHENRCADHVQDATARCSPDYGASHTRLRAPAPEVARLRGGAGPVLGLGPVVSRLLMSFIPVLLSLTFAAGEDHEVYVCVFACGYVYIRAYMNVRKVAVESHINMCMFFSHVFVFVCFVFFCMFVCLFACMCMLYVYAWVYSHTHMHTQTHTDTHSLSLTHTHTQTHTDTQTHAHTHIMPTLKKKIRYPVETHIHTYICRCIYT